MPKRRSATDDEPAAAGMEVTAKELASALAAVESRRDAAIRKDTIAIGDAISQLGFDVSPEEIAAEVELQQRTRAAADRLARQRRSRWQRWVFAGVLAASLWLNFKLLTAPAADSPSASSTVFEQSGRFTVTSGAEGLVRFPEPFRAIPNLELRVSPRFNKTVVSETMSWGFRWKNAGPDDLFNNSSVDWKARGPR